MLPSPGSPAERNAYWMSMAAVVAVHLAVLWVPAYNALVDYPFHLARAWVLHTYDQTPYFQSLFVRIFDPMPNLAIDLIVPALLHVLPPIAAGKVFLSLIVLLFAAGCHCMAAAVYGRPSWMAPVATFAVFNSIFLWGFVNSVFSISLFLVTLPAWLTFRRRWTVPRWLVVTFLATATYIAHLAGFVFLGFAMGVCRLLELRRNFRITMADVVAFSVLVPAVIIQIYPWANKVRMSGQIIWGEPSRKIVALASVFLGYNFKLTAVTLLLLAVAFGMLALKARLRAEPTLLWLGIAFLIGSIICPMQLTAGGGAAADARFVPPAVVFLFLAVTPIGSPALVRGALAVVFGAMLLRLGDVAWNLNRLSTVAEQEIAALANAAPNTRIYEIFIKARDRETERRNRGNLHVPSYALILTQSVSSDFYAERGVQPLYFRNPGEWVVGTESPDSFDPVFLDAHLRTFDYVWGCHLDSLHREYVQQRAALVSTGGSCELWKLSK